MNKHIHAVTNPLSEGIYAHLLTTVLAVLLGLIVLAVVVLATFSRTRPTVFKMSASFRKASFSMEMRNPEPRSVNGRHKHLVGPGSTETAPAPGMASADADGDLLVQPELDTDVASWPTHRQQSP